MLTEIKSSLSGVPENKADETERDTSQQVFAGKDALFIYYTEKHTTRDSKSGTYSVIHIPVFFRVPYDAKVALSSGKITFSGNLHKIALAPASSSEKITSHDADILGKESTLTFLNPGKACRSASMIRLYDPQQEKEILDAFTRPVQADTATFEITSWRILLDRYLIEKRDNQDISDTAIQTFWFSDYLARRRQARLGVKATEFFDGNGKINESLVATSGDGRCKRTAVYTSGEKTIVYSLNNAKLKIAHKRPAVFSILETAIDKKTLVCPNCGSESTTEECMNGCPFCGTRFRLTNYDYKLAGDYEGVSNMKPARLLFMLAGLIFAITFIYNLVAGTGENIALLLLSSLFSGAALGLLCYLVLQIPLAIVMFSRIIRDNRLRDFCKPLQRNDPNFSSDEFSAEIRSRIRAFFLADENDNIRFISGLKAGQYADVADVHILEYKSISVVPSNDFYIIRAIVILELIRVSNGALTRQKAPFTIDIYRAIGVKTELLTDKEVFTCPSCAASISILEGGHCKSCGTTSDLSRCGWMLGAVSPS